MSRFALIGLAVVAGCFYTESVNQRPSLDIHQKTPGPYFRGGMDPIQLEAVANDPEGHFVTFRWRVYLCTALDACDQAPFIESSDDDLDIHVPTVRLDTATEDLLGVLIKLEGKDDFGATARPIQELWVDIDNAPPLIYLDAYSDYGFVVTTPISVFAEVLDTDDREKQPQIMWKVYSPMNQPTFTLTDIVDAVPSHGGYAFGKELTPSGVGKYTVEFTASDGIVETPSVMTKDVMVVPDQPPCLRNLSPLVAVAPAALPISEPTLFQVHLISDDLDPYPAANDPLRGTSSFKWSLLAPGGSRQVLSGVTGNDVAINPASYQPGDILELRVEIADRNNTPITCTDASATCSVISDNSCLQRQTWRVEVR